jgi:DNA-directed RNA polymerase specialized sigma24 family protein
LSTCEPKIDDALEEPTIAVRLASRPQDDLRIDIARDIEEVTADEIAGTLALSRESVKGRLHRARKLLRESLLD